MKFKNNILIITSIAHERAGVEAVKKQIEKNYMNFNVIVIDEEQYGNKRAAVRRGKSHERMVQSIPTLYRHFRSAKTKMTIKTPTGDKRRAAAKKLRGEPRRIYNAILRFTPDIILVTTPKLMHDTVFAKRMTHYKYPVVGLCERYTFDKSFYNSRADGYIVENIDMKNQLTAMGYSSSRVYVLGFPIKEKTPDVDVIVKKKERLGLNLNPTVYLSGGEIGSKELFPVYELLLDQGSMINIIVNCGRNENLYSMMLSRAEKRGAENVKVYLNTDNDIEDTLAATDCLITIYDSALIYRAFLLGIPVIAYAPDNNIERADLSYLDEKGLIYYASDYNYVIIGMCDIIQNNLGKKLSETAAVRTHPDSLDDICATITSFSTRSSYKD